MKPLNKSLLYICGFIFFPLALSAAESQASTREHTLPAYEVVDVALPIPVKLVVPRVSGRLGGYQVRMIFNINADGRTTNIHKEVHSPEQEVNDLGETMKMAIRSWHFEPARDKDGNAIAIKLALPVKVVKNGGNAHEYASLAFAKPIFLAREN
ncbi:MAG: hypothetical protein O7C75_07070 [Verrucomicrobia bacterium]|nr:hypothetical protein [Verrucomicrobiota bacterium]